MKDVEEGRIECISRKDILTLALGTLEHPGRVRASEEREGKRNLNNSSTHQSPQKLLKKRNAKRC